jgi:hypothetical protein
MRRQRTFPQKRPPNRMRRGHAMAAAVVFAAGLYLNTGTLAPYANTLSPVVHVETGYIYNIDHAVHQTVFAFVNGEPRERWEHSLLLRRVLHPAAARPWMNSLGFDVGGVVFNLLINLAGFAAGVALVRRHVGARGAALAAWVFALYPGAAYWVGQPYAYGLIFPLSVAAFWVLLELPAAPGSRAMLLSVALGVMYLGYDLHVFFFPASLLLLLWHRRFAAAVLSAGLQVAPLGLWLYLLKHVVRIPLENSNSGIYRELVVSFFRLTSWSAIGERLASIPEVAADVFFGANFLFLPLLALVAWVYGSRRPALSSPRAAVCLLAATAALFLFCNLPPPHPGAWNLQGAWIARLYQPMFPALVFWLAGWWEQQPTACGSTRLTALSLVGVALGANALICFGPALANPLRVSEHAFYRFYDHTERHWLYERNLEHFGRRPLGLPRPPNLEKDSRN